MINYDGISTGSTTNLRLTTQATVHNRFGFSTHRLVAQSHAVELPSIGPSPQGGSPMLSDRHLWEQTFFIVQKNWQGECAAGKIYKILAI